MYPTPNFRVDPGQCVLLIIDPQNDFHDGGSLRVPGASEQAIKSAEFIRTNKGRIGEIFVTLDSHHKKHIAHQAFWSSIENDADGKGNEPAVFSHITEDDLLNGKWYPKDCSLQSYCQKYTRRLESQGRFKLTIWPDHCLIGSAGHAIEPNIQAAIREWDISHYKKTVKHIHKGMNCLTEMYSAIEAEVPIPSDPTTTRNSELLDALYECGRLIVFGQALSHCVNFTVRDIVKDWQTRIGLEAKERTSEEVRRRVEEKKRQKASTLVVVVDACAPVAGCEADADQFIADMKAAGVTVTTLDKAFDGWTGPVITPALLLKEQSRLAELEEQRSSVGFA